MADRRYAIEALDKLRAVLRLDDPPWRIALALGVGVFISCTPFWGVQTLLSVVVATVCRLNKAATVTGTWLNLPWFAPFVYGAALKIGTAVVPDPEGARRAWLTWVIEHPASLTWPDLLALFHELSVALLIGTTVVGGLAGAVTYLIALGVISHRRARRPAAKSRERRAG